MDDISFSKRRKNRRYAYLCAGSVICVSLLRAPQYSTFACCLIPVLTLVVLLVMLDDIDDISFSKRRYFLIVSWMSISVYCIPTRDTHITRDMCMGIHISRGYTYHCDTVLNLGIIFNFTGDTQYPPCESGGVTVRVALTRSWSAVNYLGWINHVWKHIVPTRKR